jgi:integrase
MKIKLRHIRREKSGLLSYLRGIPKDLQEHYGGKRFLVESLRTHDPALALNAAQTLANRDDLLWANLRPDRPTSPELLAQETKTLLGLVARSYEKAKGPTLSDARTEYEKNHTGKKVQNDIALCFNFAIAVIGNRHLADLKRADGKAILEAMIARQWKTATISRRLAILSAIVAKGLLEFEIDARNPFSKLTIPNLLKDAKDVQPFSESELRIIGAACLHDGESESGLVAGLQLETGLRVSEAAYLKVEDINLDAAVGLPHLLIRENARRRLKNAASARKIPLVGGCVPPRGERGTGEGSNRLCVALPRHSEPGEQYRVGASQSLASGGTWRGTTFAPIQTFMRTPAEKCRHGSGNCECHPRPYRDR